MTTLYLPSATHSMVRADVGVGRFGSSVSLRLRLDDAIPVAIDGTPFQLDALRDVFDVTLSGRFDAFEQVEEVAETVSELVPDPGPAGEPNYYKINDVLSGQWGHYETPSGDYVSKLDFWARGGTLVTEPGEWQGTTFVQDTWVGVGLIEQVSEAAGDLVEEWTSGPPTFGASFNVQVGNAGLGTDAIDELCEALLRHCPDSPQELAASVQNLATHVFDQLSGAVEDAFTALLDAFDVGEWDYADLVPDHYDLRQLLKGSQAALDTLNDLRTAVQQRVQSLLAGLWGKLVSFCQGLVEASAALTEDGFFLVTLALGILLLPAALPLIVVAGGADPLRELILGLSERIAGMLPDAAPGFLGTVVGWLEQVLTLLLGAVAGALELVEDCLTAFMVELVRHGEELWLAARGFLADVLEAVVDLLATVAVAPRVFVERLVGKLVSVLRSSGLLEQLGSLTPPGAGAGPRKPGGFQPQDPKRVPKSIEPEGAPASPPAPKTPPPPQAPASPGKGGALGAPVAGSAFSLPAGGGEQPPASAGNPSQVFEAAGGGLSSGGGLQRSGAGGVSQLGGGKRAGAPAKGGALGAAGGGRAPAGGRTTGALPPYLAGQLDRGAAASLGDAEVPAAGHLCGELVLVLSQPLPNPWASAGWLLNAFVSLFEELALDLGNLLVPLFKAIKDAVRVTADQFFDLVNHLDEDLLRPVAQWIWDAWLFVRDAILEPFWEQIQEWLRLFLGILSEAQEALFAELEQLRPTLNWMASLPETILASPLLDLAENGWEQTKELLRDTRGISGWIQQRSEETGASMVEVVRDLVQNNPLSQGLEAVSSQIRSLPLIQGSEREGRQMLEDLAEQVGHLGEEAARIWRVLDQDHDGQVDPFILNARIEGLQSDSLLVQGGEVVSSGVEFVGGVLGGKVSTGGLGEGMSLLSLEGRLQPLVLPRPDSVLPVDWSTSGAQSRTLDVPLPFPVPFHSAVAVAHRAKLWCIDMRYHMPYGTGVGLFQVLDPDGVGEVWGAKVKAIEDYLADPSGEADLSLDVDQDGEITANDLTLARLQQRNYVNGIMYREAEAPLGFYVAITPHDWAFTTLIPLAAGVPYSLDESIPSHIDRYGVMSLVTGQACLPGLDYRVRFHYEGRYFLDVFQVFNLEDFYNPEDHPEGGLPSFPLAATPGMRHDLIVRGGDQGRDWQAHLTSQPFNPMLRMWTLKGTLFLKGLLSYFGIPPYAEPVAGVQGEGDLKITAIYKTKAPLIAVLEQWHSRLSHLTNDLEGALPSEFPVPWAMIKGILEYSDLPQLCRGLIGASGPFVDLFFEWVDDNKCLRSSLGLIRQTVLSQWTPCPSWGQVRAEIAAWDPAEVGGEEWHELLLEACDQALADFSSEGEPVYADDPLFCPNRLERALRRALSVALAEQAEAIAPTSTQAIQTPSAEGASGGGAPPADLDVDALEALDAARRAAEAKLDAYFANRRRFAAGSDQLVQRESRLSPPRDDDHDRTWIAVPDQPTEPVVGQLLLADVPQGSQVEIPGCGTYALRRPYMVAFPLERKDVEEASESEGESVGEALLWTRGNPFYKPLYHALVEFGVGSQLYTVPCQRSEFLIDPVGDGEAGVVEDSHVLEDVNGDVWLWVRTRTFKFGWLCVEKELWERIFCSPTGAAANLGEEIAGKLMSPDDFALAKETLEQLGIKQSIKRLESSPRETVDDSRYAAIARRVLARRDAGEDLEEWESTCVALYEGCLQEVNIRIIGYEAAEEAIDDGELDQAELKRLGEVFANLPPVSREKLWSATTAWLKSSCYLPFIGHEILDRFVPPLLHGEWGEALEQARQVLENMATFSAEEAILATQRATPYLLQSVVAVISIAQKLVKVAELFEGLGEKDEDEAAGEGGAEGASEEAGGSEGEDSESEDLEVEIEGEDSSLSGSYDSEEQKVSAEAEAGESSASGWLDLDDLEGEVEGEGKLSVGGGKADSPSWDNLGVMLLRLFVDDQEAPGRPAPKAGDGGHDWGIQWDARLKVENLNKDTDDYEEPEGTKEVTLNLARPIAGKVTCDVEHGHELEPETETVTFQVHTWSGQLGEGEEVVENIDADRIPKALLDRLRWEKVTSEGQVVELGRGPLLKFKLPVADVDREFKVRAVFQDADFEAAVQGELLGEGWSPPPLEAGRACYFPWELVRVDYCATGPATLVARVGGEALPPFDLPARRTSFTLDLRQPLPGSAETATLESSPIELRFEGEVEAFPGEPPAPPPRKPGLWNTGRDVSGGVDLDFGKDSLSITFQTEAKGGAGVGDEAGTGASAGVTTGPRFSLPTVEIPMEMLASEQAVAILLRFVVRYFHHAVEAVYFAWKWFEEQRHELSAEGEDDWIEDYCGFGFWTMVYLAFALKETIFELAHDHAQWIADLLQSVKFCFRFDWSARLGGTVVGKAEVTGEVHGTCDIPLGTLLWPVLEALQQFDSAEREGPSLADLITPCIKANLEDVFTLKAGMVPILVEIESRGQLAEGSVFIPKGSPLMERVRQVTAKMSGAAEQWNAAKQSRDQDAEGELPEVDRAHEFLRLLRLVLGVIYDELQALLVDRSAESAWTAASPIVTEIMNQVMGDDRPIEDPRDLGEAARELLDRIEGCGLHGVPLEPGHVLHVEGSAESGKRKLWLYLDEEELAALQGGGWSPPTPPEEVLETVTWSVTLPAVPQSLSWHVWEDPDADATFSGIVAGFSNPAMASAFAGSRSASWLDGALAGQEPWERDDLHWTWVETGLIQALSDADLALPELEHAGASLLLTFHRVELDQVGASLAPVLGQAARHERSALSKVVLLEEASVDEQREILAKIQANQPAPPPTPFPEDDEEPAPTSEGEGEQAPSVTRPPAGWVGVRGTPGQGLPDAFVRDPRRPRAPGGMPKFSARWRESSQQASQPARPTKLGKPQAPKPRVDPQRAQASKARATRHQGAQVQRQQKLTQERSRASARSQGRASSPLPARARPAPRPKTTGARPAARPKATGARPAAKPRLEGAQAPGAARLAKPAGRGKRMVRPRGRKGLPRRGR